MHPGPEHSSPRMVLGSDCRELRLFSDNAMPVAPGNPRLRITGVGQPLCETGILYNQPPDIRRKSHWYRPKVQWYALCRKDTLPRTRSPAASELLLPQTLNAANDIDAGMHGLEQRRTPIDVGQRTLEGP